MFGRSTFSKWELSQVAEPNPELIQTLEDEEFLVRDPDREGVWRFRHDMLRDVAYETLAKRDRQRFHVQVAEAIERSNESDRYPQAMAFHLEQAARASLDLDPRDRSLPDRAVKALARAGDVARWRMESRTAIDLYQRALALAGPEDGWGQREARILSSAGEARYWLGEFQQAKSTLLRALAIGGPDPWTRTHANRFLGDVVLNSEGDPDKAGPIFEEAMAGAKELNDPFASARTLLMAGWVPYWRGDLEGAHRMFEEALRMARENPDPDGDAWGEARALVALTSVVSPSGNEEEALQMGRRELEHRLVVVAATTCDAERALSTRDPAAVVRGRRREATPPVVAFAFPGQGTEYLLLAQDVHPSRILRSPDAEPTQQLTLSRRT